MRRRKPLTTLLTLLTIPAIAAAIAACGGKATSSSETKATPGHHKPPSKPGHY